MPSTAVPRSTSASKSVTLRSGASHSATRHRVEPPTRPRLPRWRCWFAMPSRPARSGFLRRGPALTAMATGIPCRRGMRPRASSSRSRQCCATIRAHLSSSSPPSVDLSPSTENLRGRLVTLTARAVMSTPRGQAGAAARCQYSFHLYRASYFAGSVFAFAAGAGGGGGVMPWGEMVLAFG